MKREPAAPLTYAVSAHGDFLATRGVARTALRDLEDRISFGAATHVVIDFTDVKAMTISFADEFLGRYYSALAANDRPPTTVLLTGLNEENQETVAVCLERRELFAAEVNHGHIALIAASEVLDQTFEVAAELHRFTATDLAEQLSISAPNANNRLKRLVAARALIRQRGIAERGGKEFTYSLPLLPSTAGTL
ncbi:hypothetical protein JNW90_07270 [Micromonospora sp. STR1s_5]|nr:hypothetical protein [Micromonospora sp. STR1s_5]